MHRRRGSGFRDGFALIEMVLAFGLLALGMLCVLQLPIGMERQAKFDAGYQSALLQARRALDQWISKPFNELDVAGGKVLHREDAPIDPAASASPNGAGTVRLIVSGSAEDTDLVRVTVQATWTRSGGTSSLELVALRARPDASLHGTWDVVPAAEEVN